MSSPWWTGRVRSTAPSCRRAGYGGGRQISRRIGQPPIGTGHLSSVTRHLSQPCRLTPAPSLFICVIGGQTLLPLRPRPSLRRVSCLSALPQGSLCALCGLRVEIRAVVVSVPIDITFTGFARGVPARRVFRPHSIAPAGLTGKRKRRGGAGGPAYPGLAPRGYYQAPRSGLHVVGRRCCFSPVRNLRNPWPAIASGDGGCG